MVPGDEIFIPSFAWPKNSQRDTSYPPKHRLKKNLAYTKMELTKEENTKTPDLCNATIGYRYEGTVKLI